MKKLLTAIGIAAAFTAPAQPLFTYGKEAVQAPEFLRAFQKSNQGQATESALKEYLDLYIGSRLKIKQAKDLGYDTLPQLVADLSNLRQQILINYLNDKESLDKMVQETFQRSQKDIHLAHIFIKEGENAAQKKAQVLQAITKLGFAEAARTYSDDPSAKTNGGDIGWMTVFSLPYELENIAYTTPVGKVSAAFHSKAGYHILKNLGERKALGRVRSAQILLAIPPNSTEEEKAGIKKTADSLYIRLLAGDDFGKLAAAFSNDVVSAASNGQMTEFGVGEYDPAFEAAVLGLSGGASISKPFLTAYGYHIVRRLNILPVSARLDENTRESLRKRIEESDRSRYLQTALIKKVLKQAGHQKLSFADAELEAYTDSVLINKKPPIRVTITSSTPLLKIGSSSVTATEWIAYAQSWRYNQDGSIAKPFSQLWNEFVAAQALAYYQNNLEEFNEDFRRQVTEFAEGNLFFEIMQRRVWTPAQTDSAALLAYYQQHKQQYNWKESADAVLFFASDEATAKEAHTTLLQNPAGWRAVAEKYQEQLTLDSNRFELEQIPNKNKTALQAGMLTTPVTNTMDNTISFAYVIRLYPQPGPRSFADAKALVITDYQLLLEKEWLGELKKKYPVTINPKVWNKVVQKAKRKA